MKLTKSTGPGTHFQRRHLYFTVTFHLEVSAGPALLEEPGSQVGRP